MMHPPSQQNTVHDSQSRPVSSGHGTKLGLDFIRAQMKDNSIPPPFSYEYVLEDGKMPMLAEFHAVERNSTAGVLRSSSTRSAINPRSQRRPVPINRSSSYNRHEKQPFHIDSHFSLESTADKLKRAFSLSSSKTSAQPSRQPSAASHRDQTKTALPQPSRHISQTSRRPVNSLGAHNSTVRRSTPPSESRVPSLVLPTPTPSPEPPSSAASSPQKPPMNFGLPDHHAFSSARPFSWVHSEDDDNDDDDLDDLLFLQENGMGRLNANFRPAKQFRKEKAFEILGIANKERSLPQTRATSAATSYKTSPAPSDRDHLSRNSSRRISRDYRHGVWTQSAQAEVLGGGGSSSGQSNRISTPKTSPIAPFLDQDNTTPRAIAAGPQRTIRQYEQARKPISKNLKSPVFAKKPISISRPQPIIVPDFPSPPANTESRSAPPILLRSSKPEPPLHALHTNTHPLPLAEPQPLPVSIARASRFIEHLDANAKRLSLPVIHNTNPVAPRPAFLVSRTFSDPDIIAPAPRRATSPLPPSLRNLPSPQLPKGVVTEASRSVAAAKRELSSSGSGVRRSVSMREPASGPWGAVVCTAQARPIVAAGHARMV